jgi:hypothetical protein
MNRKTNLLILLAGLALPHGMQAATYSVFSGQSIQAKIDAASSGDTVAVFGGSYTENLTINKDVRLQLVAGQTVTLAGNITFSGLNNAYTFGKFNFGGQSDKAITINNCKSFTLSSVKSTIGNILITGSECTANIFNCSLARGNITVSDQATADFARCTVTGNVTVNSTVKRATFSRCTVTEAIDSSATTTCVAYSTLRFFRQRGNGVAYLIGNTINERNHSVYGEATWTIEAFDSSRILLKNNIIRQGSAGSYRSTEEAVRISSLAQLEALNNVIYDYSNGYYGWGRAIRLDGSAASLISSNIGYAIQYEFVMGPFANNSVTYNLSQTGESGGVLLQNRVNADPAFVDTTDFVLGPTSPARNAGDPDSRFNDIDGTRNDMGIYGGPFYDPEGRTGSKPVVMQMELDQTQFLRGDYSTLKLKAVGSATGTAP